MLLSSVPKEGTIPVLPAPLQPPPLQGQSFLHPKIPTGKPPRIFKDAAARVLAFKMLLRLGIKAAPQYSPNIWMGIEADESFPAELLLLDWSVVGFYPEQDLESGSPLGF
ncbi:hypothetical protein DV515_00013970 [Chloebia gouldiae]|uniref:Uncharacterized protein n=1 Tax=Chloebia gouldiae TaxID=44316 RepID=A0A3L8S0U2_CHLGU|nr:hypothetical protein DV515_00013970 [Chloebia gouldiae]